MAIFQQNVPASLRFVPTSAKEDRGGTADRRPYLIIGPPRRPVVSARQTVTVTSTRQFFPLFPHESEDARITGATRSLYRRLLALNLPRPVARAEAEPRDGAEVRFSLVDSRIA